MRSGPGRYRRGQSTVTVAWTVAWHDCGCSWVAAAARVALPSPWRGTWTCAGPPSSTFTRAGVQPRWPSPYLASIT
ncbi:hypothetical protein HMPREF9946_00021 [Acetobacteraceae bacterium AT-5844]|nr:hypothetical protein HMPREF9946_00021 [Acetobacteraceae bacterium AT-5844]